MTWLHLAIYMRSLGTYIRGNLLSWPTVFLLALGSVRRALLFGCMTDGRPTLVRNRVVLGSSCLSIICAFWDRMGCLENHTRGMMTTTVDGNPD